MFFQYIYCMMWEVAHNKGLKCDHLQIGYVLVFGGCNKHVHYVHKSSVLFRNQCKLPINSLTLGKLLSSYIEYNLQIA